MSDDEQTSDDTTSQTWGGSEGRSGWLSIIMRTFAQRYRGVAPRELE